jgi:hypothetical protein
MVNTNSIVERGRHTKSNKVTKLEIGLLSASIVISGLGLEHVASREAQFRADCIRRCRPALGSLANRVTLDDSVASRPSPVVIPHITVPKRAIRHKPIDTINHAPPVHVPTVSVPQQQSKLFISSDTTARRLITANDVGNDVSYPDCVRVLPQGQLFGLDCSKPATSFLH